LGAVCATARADFERLGDALRSEPAAVLRPGAKPFLFAGRRLRALREFVAECGGSGLSTMDQTRLCKLLVLGSWQAREGEEGREGTAHRAVAGASGSGDPGPGSDGLGGGPAEDTVSGSDDAEQPNKYGIGSVFRTATSFRNATRDDLDRSILDAGWRKVCLIEGGRPYVAFFQCALTVVVAHSAAAKRKQLRRRAETVGSRRDHPMDGEAFALHQAEIYKVTAEVAFVLGVHFYSDCTLLSRSGGTFRIALVMGVAC